MQTSDIHLISDLLLSIAQLKRESEGAGMLVVQGRYMDLDEHLSGLLEVIKVTHFRKRIAESVVRLRELGVTVDDLDFDPDEYVVPRTVEASFEDDE